MRIKLYNCAGILSGKQHQMTACNKQSHCLISAFGCQRPYALTEQTRAAARGRQRSSFIASWRRTTEEIFSAAPGGLNYCGLTPNARVKRSL